MTDNNYEQLSTGQPTYWHTDRNKIPDDFIVTYTHVGSILFNLVNIENPSIEKVGNMLAKIWAKFQPNPRKDTEQGLFGTFKIKVFKNNDRGESAALGHVSVSISLGQVVNKESKNKYSSIAI